MLCDNGIRCEWRRRCFEVLYRVEKSVSDCIVYRYTPPYKPTCARKVSAIDCRQIKVQKDEEMW